jgi:DNA-binding NarL/FixJ family response regulator
MWRDADGKRDYRLAWFPWHAATSCQPEAGTGGGCTDRSREQWKRSGVIRKRLVLADDDVLLREGLAALLDRSGYEVIGQVDDTRLLLDLVREHEPDLAIVDIRMRHAIEGLDAALVIREELPQTALLLLSAHVEIRALDLLRRGPRCGYLLKGSVLDIDGFLETLERILAGGSVVEQALAGELARRRDPLDRLSPRERDVLQLMAEGRSNAGIAHRLGLAKATVERYVHGVLLKLVPLETADHRRVLAVLTYLGVR